jgi:hypothetical protein
MIYAFLFFCLSLFSSFAYIYYRLNEIEKTIIDLGNDRERMRYEIAKEFERLDSKETV